MFTKVARRLFLANTAVFLIVLTIFSVAVYAFVVHNVDREEKRGLTTLTDAVVDSFEAEDAVPEIIVPGRQDFVLEGASLQWFDSAGTLVAQKGPLALSVPFYKDVSFQRQAKPHALLLTRPVRRQGNLSGYLRAGIPLGEFDKYSSKLLAGLAFGIGLALVAAGIGVLWLVRQALKPLEHTMQKLTQFTSDASHELRNPLMAIKTNAAVALRHEDGMREKDMAKFVVIVDATDQMIRTTTDLLKLAQTEQYTKLEHAVPLNLSEMILQLKTEMTGQTAAKNIKIETELAEQLFTIAREEDMKSLLGNIFENAVQYTNGGGKVSVKSYRQGKRAVIEIIDSGIGIKSDELPKIFDRFWRSDRARSHRNGGSGLGMAIVRAILDRYGGDISVSSKLGEGTKMIITLPAAE